MIAIITSLAPVFLLILSGWLVRRRRWVADAFWQPAETLTFYILFPALLIHKIALADMSAINLPPIMGATVGGMLIVGGVLVALRRRMAGAGLSSRSFTSVFQGSVRPNSYIGIAAALALFGNTGVTVISAAITVAAPLANFLGVLVLVRYANGTNGGGEDTYPRWRDAVLPIIKNPLILATLIGVSLNWSGAGLPPVIGPFLAVLGQAALPIGLMAVGAGLDFAAITASGRWVAATVAVKQIALPLVTFLLFYAFGGSGPAAAMTVMFAALPCSAVSYVMSRKMGGDATLMAGIITATTLTATIAMSVVVMALS
ncbi:MAG TPA: AEC family transporter [Alphaproteobacteria bacterium]|nr:AEC family transporter [Alphaproteobacteria bacterium]